MSTKRKPTCTRGYSCGFSCISRSLTCSKNVGADGSRLLENYAQFLQRTEPKQTSLLDSDINAVLDATEAWAKKHGLDDVDLDSHDPAHVLMHSAISLDSVGIKQAFGNSTSGDISIQEEMLVGFIENQWETQYFKPSIFRPNAPLPSEEEVRKKAIAWSKDNADFIIDLYPEILPPDKSSEQVAEEVTDFWLSARKTDSWQKMLNKYIDVTKTLKDGDPRGQK